jgi:hypothetical protein
MAASSLFEVKFKLRPTVREIQRAEQASGTHGIAAATQRPPPARGAGAGVGTSVSGDDR